MIAQIRVQPHVTRSEATGREGLPGPAESRAGPWRLVRENAPENRQQA
jgi:hypothetical protein